uniref:Vitamin K-dependent protein C n=1 Tax=Gouania willdenowi TaxID=441366 RepID=A0A8C5H6E6_GOUWI
PHLMLIFANLTTFTICHAHYLPPPKAHMLLRSRRANSFLEELKPASMERECMEERCDFEEAREIFQTREATLEFWTVSHDVLWFFDPMESSLSCCVPALTATNCSVDNGGCDHECTENDGSPTRRCSCLKGYKLDDNHRKCVPKGKNRFRKNIICWVSITLGNAQNLNSAIKLVGKKGESPWQVLLLNARGRFHCGGVLIHESWVLTAAHCLENNLRFRVRMGDFLLDEGTEVTLKVDKTFPHPNFQSQTVENDIALLHLETPAPFSDYIVPVCLPGREMAERVLHLNGTVTVVTGWGKEDMDSAQFSSALNVIKVPLVSHNVCAHQMQPFNISTNVLCAGVLGQRMDACEGDSGGPMVTLYRDTWFLVGLVSWGDGCGKEDKLGIYTKVSNYNDWIIHCFVRPQRCIGSQTRNIIP